jgi:hypothetical protein
VGPRLEVTNPARDEERGGVGELFEAVMYLQLVAH